MGWQDQAWSQDLWYSGKIARRRFLSLGAAAAGAIGAWMLVPAPWRGAFGQARPYRIGSLQSLTGVAAIAGRASLIGTELAVRRINASQGINGRPVELVVEDDQSRGDTGRRKAEKLASQDRIDAHQGGFLSDVCLACMSVWEQHRIVNMIGGCLDQRITTSRCSRYSFRPFDYAPAQAVAFAPSLIKMAKRWHIVYADYTWGQSTRDAHGPVWVARDRGFGQAVAEIALEAQGERGHLCCIHQTPLRARRSWASSYGLSVTFTAMAC